MANSNNESFVHSSSDVKFKERSDAIFGGLSGLEVQYEKEVRKDDPFAETYVKKQKPRRPHKVPDHVLHPEKWTKYSLEEDGTSTAAKGKTGDALNKEIAMNFINELRNRKAREEEKCEDQKMETSMEEQSNTHKTSLKRKREQIEEDEEKALILKQANKDKGIVNRSTKVIMKPYEFGQKETRKSSFRSKVEREDLPEKELDLSHLNESLIDTGEDSRDNEKTTETKNRFNTVRKTKRNLRKSEVVDDD